MSHERTVEQLTAEIEHLTGVKLRIGWMPFRGLYLEDRETGHHYPLGASSKKTILLPAEQESICRHEPRIGRISSGVLLVAYMSQNF